MATYLRSDWFKLKEHRTWEDLTSMVVGALIVVSPLLAGYSAEGAVLINAGLVGTAVVAIAAMELVELRRWEEWLELACGAWLIASPFIFQYGGALLAWHVALGTMVALLALFELWQDWRKRLVT